MQGGLEHQPSEWPQWLQRRNKIPGISENAGAMWYDTRNQQLLLNMFPSANECPQDEEHYKVRNAIFAPFLYKMHHFAKTGSGQT